MSKYAVCIGINNYPGTQNDLSGCINDANDWAATLKQRGFEVQLLLDKQATKRAMVAAMQQLLVQAKYGDSAVITYSGHGTWLVDDDGDEPDRRDEALCPHDIGSAGPLTDDELHDIFLERERGVRLVMISDSCHSGTVAKFADFELTGEKVRYLAPSEYVRDAGRLRDLRRVERAPPRGKSRASALLMAGCQDVEYSWDAEFKGRPNGAFTRVALDALRKLDADATYAEWFKAIRKKLPSASYPQTPNLVASTHQKKWPLLG